MQPSTGHLEAYLQVGVDVWVCPCGRARVRCHVVGVYCCVRVVVQVLWLERRAWVCEQGRNCIESVVYIDTGLC